MPPRKATQKAVTAPKEEKELTKGTKKRGPAKKPVSEEEDELDNEEIDEEDEDFDEEDEEDEDEEEDDEDFEETSKQNRTLFIKNLPMETTEEQVKALSADIVEVRMDVSQNKSEKNPKYAILMFNEPDLAEKNLEKLKGLKVNGADIFVDFVGGKMAFYSAKPQLTPLSDPLKLYVTGFGRDIVIDQLKEMFPTSSDITLPLNPKDNNRPVGYAFIHYNDELVAKEAHDSMQDYVYQGRTLVVMYGKRTNPADIHPTAQQTKRKGQPAKGAAAAKRSKKSQEDEEDDDDEDVDDDEELDDEEVEDEEEEESE